MTSEERERWNEAQVAAFRQVYVTIAAWDAQKGQKYLSELIFDIRRVVTEAAVAADNIQLLAGAGCGLKAVEVVSEAVTKARIEQYLDGLQRHLVLKGFRLEPPDDPKLGERFLNVGEGLPPGPTEFEKQFEAVCESAGVPAGVFSAPPQYRGDTADPEPDPLRKKVNEGRGGPVDFAAVGDDEDDSEADDLADGKTWRDRPPLL